MNNRPNRADRLPHEPRMFRGVTSHWLRNQLLLAAAGLAGALSVALGLTAGELQPPPSHQRPVVAPVPSAAVEASAAEWIALDAAKPEQSTEQGDGDSPAALPGRRSPSAWQLAEQLEEQPRMDPDVARLLDSRRKATSREETPGRARVNRSVAPPEIAETPGVARVPNLLRMGKDRHKKKSVASNVRPAKEIAFRPAPATKKPEIDWSPVVDTPIEPVSQKTIAPAEVAERNPAVLTRAEVPAATARQKSTRPSISPARNTKSSLAAAPIRPIETKEQQEGVASVPTPAPIALAQGEAPPPAPAGGDTDAPESLEYVGFKPIGQLTTDIDLEEGENPPDLASPEFELVEPVVIETYWIDRSLTAPLLPFYHQPLYFEDPNAERCGQSWGLLQPVKSAAHFYLTIPALPYLVATYPPDEPVESLGYCAWGCRYRFRDAYLPRFSWKGVAAQSAAVTGLIFLIP